uniref:Uncharacterized protein n=1 Tax=Anguilla anguilla TaxID=7936 RepID=A0A0E9RWW3_ANGAN
MHRSFPPYHCLSGIYAFLMQPNPARHCRKACSANAQGNPQW